MRIEIIEYQEEKDGGATVTLDIDEEGKNFLIEKGFNGLIRDGLEKMKSEMALDELVKSAQEDGDYDIEWWEHECLEQERDVISFPKGTECDWCGITEETYEHNKKTIERLKQYEEMRNEG